MREYGYDDEDEFHFPVDNPKERAERLEREVASYANEVVSLVSSQAFDPYLTDYHADLLIRAYLRANPTTPLKTGEHYLPIRKRAQYILSGAILQELDMVRVTTIADAINVINGEWRYLAISQSRDALSVEMLLHGKLKRSPGDKPNWISVTPIDIELSSNQPQLTD